MLTKYKISGQYRCYVVALCFITKRTFVLFVYK